ncbi:hypothetical protein P691DRAFT_811565 [Macrolepiota fuliginosa MF-IS2]|uniref:Uncharacterized protein n=1 Tax=Macrolepiota fuliginosa MF-IS2 TaxID=1400762 RepID=A0A9P5WZP2_9AGAR|nr:hypothetical protein P691DRAFT_811565 [Macrolepiota fuliginosa MF-IS2]
MPNPMPFPSTPSVSGTQLSRPTDKNDTLELGLRDSEFGHEDMKWRRGGSGEWMYGSCITSRSVAKHSAPN